LSDLAQLLQGIAVGQIDIDQDHVRLGFPHLL
jgi:hypothetical protein